MACRSWSADSGGNSGTPESSRKHLNPNDPRLVQLGQVSEALRHGAGPEADVDVHLLRRHAA